MASSSTEQVVWLGNQGNPSPLNTAFKQLQEVFLQYNCPDPILAIRQSEPIELCLADMGHSSLIGADVAGIQARASWKNVSIVWELRWDADGTKGEHINLKVTPYGQKKQSWAFCTGSSSEEGCARFKYDTRITYQLPGKGRQTLKEGNRVPSNANHVCAHKPPGTLQAMMNLTTKSGYSYAEMKRARDERQYRREMAREVLIYWDVAIVNREVPKWNIYSTGPDSGLPEPRW